MGGPAELVEGTGGAGLVADGLADGEGLLVPRLGLVEVAAVLGRDAELARG